MTTKTGELSVALVKNGASSAPIAFESQCADWFKLNAKRLANMWGSEDEAKKLLLVAMEVVNKNQFLLKCTFESFARSLLTCSEMRLYPGALQEAAIVPLKNNRTGKYEANLWIQYQGLVKLAFNSGFVKSITSNVVYEADDFDFCLGTNQYLKHKPFLGSSQERGDRRCVYCCIETTQGNQIVVLPMSFIEGIKNKSPGSRSGSSPWNGTAEDYDAMARKTALRQALKLVPKSTTLAKALDVEVDSTQLDLNGAVSIAIEETSQTQDTGETKESAGA